MVNKKKLIDIDDNGEFSEKLAQALQNIIKKFIIEE